MKHILTLALALAALAAPAQIFNYPVQTPSTRIIAGDSSVVVVTNGVNNFTLTAASRTNYALLNATNVFTGTNSFSEVVVSGALFYVTAAGNLTANSLIGTAYAAGDFVWAKGNSSGFYWGAGQDTYLNRVSAGVISLNAGSGTMTLGTLNTTNLVVGAGAAVTKILSATATLDFNLTASVTEDAGGIAVTGADVGDVVVLGVPAAAVTATIQFSAWVSAANTVTIRARTAAVGENPGSGSFRITVIKF